MRLGTGAGTPDEEGSEAEGAPSSSSGRRAGSGARRAKRLRLVWTMELNKRFLDAVMHLVRHAPVVKQPALHRASIILCLGVLLQHVLCKRLVLAAWPLVLTEFPA